MDAFFRRFFPHDGDATLGYHRALAAQLGGARALLDFGCGDNTDLAPYRAAGRDVWGADFQAHPRLTHAERFRLLTPDGAAPFPDASFDLIAARWVLEHVREPEAFLAEVRRLLRPGGRFVALTINAAHYVTGLTRLVGLLPHAVTQRLVRRLYGRACHDTFPTWYRMNTGPQLRRLARRAGLRLAGLTRFANADYFSFAPRLRRAAVLLDWLLERAGTDLGRLYLVATFRKPERLEGTGPAGWAKPGGYSLDNGRSTCYGLRGKCA
jgi:SAM-dependent methyltransferase